ncbi:MAG TPA: hypothetical protein PK010_01665 [Alphaproteobacteria bacterium]|nr:hypothetical protein [Alphaproteobacteria bacterium]
MSIAKATRERRHDKVKALQWRQPTLGQR